MIDFFWPFYPLRWRELIKELKQKGCFDVSAVKNFNSEFLYNYFFTMGALTVLLLFNDKVSVFFAFCFALGGYVTLGLAYQVDNFKRFYLYNRSEKRKAVIVSPIKNDWFILGFGTIYFFDYEYPVKGGVQKTRCMYGRRYNYHDNFYSDFYEGAEILILVDEEYERSSIVPMKHLEKMYKFDLSVSIDADKK